MEIGFQFRERRSRSPKEERMGTTSEQKEKINGRRPDLPLDYPVTEHPKEKLGLTDFKGKEYKELFRRLRNAKLIGTKRIVDYRQNVQKLGIKNFSDEELKVAMARLGLEHIPFEQYLDFDEQVHEPFLLDFICTTWRGVKKPNENLLDLRTVYQLAHYAGMKNTLKTLFPLVDPQSEGFLKELKKRRMAAVLSERRLEEFGLFLVSWLYNMNVTVLHPDYTMWMNHTFVPRVETNVWILLHADGWIYAWQTKHPPSLTDEITESARDLILIGPLLKTWEEQLEGVTKQLDEERKKQEKILEEKAEATEFVWKALQHQAEVTRFINRLECRDEEEEHEEEQQPKKGKKKATGKEHETWLENVRKVMVTAKSKAQVAKMCTVAATGALQEGIELNQALLKTKQVQKKNVPRTEAAISNATSSVIDKARQCVAEAMEDHQKVVQMLQQAQVALEPKAPEEQQSTPRKQMIQPTDLPEELLFQEVEIEGEGAREELVIKLPIDPSEKQIPVARSPQKTPKKDIPCTHEGCDIMFSNFRAQKLHRVEQHQEMVPGIKVKECPVCKKLLAFDSRLREHLVTHTKERNATYSFCRMTFSRPSARNAHKKTQHGKFWCICWVCKNQYMSLKYLKHHHTNKHEGLCYACT